MSQKIEQALRGPEGFSSMVYLWGSLSLLGSLFFPLIFILLCLFGLVQTERPLWEVKAFVSRHFPPLLRENLRSWGQILKWSFAFIIPGLVKYVHYTFVPFVVTLSRVYERGEADALELSTALVRKNFAKILGLIFLFFLFIPLIVSSLFDDYRRLFETPLACLGLTLLDTYICLLGVQCFWVVFKNSTERSL